MIHAESSHARPARRQPAAQRESGAPGGLEQPSWFGDSPRMAAQRQRLQSVFGPAVAGPAVVQRVLQTRDKANDEPKTYTPENLPGFINLYQSHLAADSSVLVAGKSGGTNGLLKEIKATQLNGAEVRDALIGSVMLSSAWREMENLNMRKALADHVLGTIDTVHDFNTATTAGVEDVLNEARTTYLDEVRGWVATKLEPLATAVNVGGIPGGEVPKEWHTDLAQIVYDATKALHYGPGQFKANAYQPPFKKLIGEVNQGLVTELRYVRKYGQNTSPGAEFTVESPAERRDAYAGKAVVHTHYEATDETPNYAHTKPYEQRYANGYGYTVVNTGQVRAIDDTAKTWDALP